MKRILSLIIAVMMIMGTMVCVSAEGIETSSHSRAYTSESTYWGQCWGSADESFEFKFYNNDTYMGYTSLINVGGIIDGDVEVSWHIKLGVGTEEYTSECGYWKMKWDIEPTIAMQPTRVEHWVDGVKAAECALEPNWSDSIFPIVAAVTDDSGKILSYVNNHIDATLSNAFAAGGNITMLKDVTLSETLTVDGTIVLDLNGKTITYNSTTQGEAMITNKGNLTIEDSVGTGVINYNYTGAADSTYSKGNYTISNGGTLTVNDGKITIANLSGHAKYPINNNSTTGDAILVINGGHLYNYNTSAIRQFCNSTTNKNSVAINGGLVEGYCAIWVQNPGKNIVNGSLKITGGEIKSTAKAWVNGTAELKDVSSRIYCTIDGEGGAWSEDSAVSITGGTINENVYLEENAPAAITIGESATFKGYVTIPEEEVVKTLPNAEVNNLGAITVNEDSHYEYDLIGNGGLSTKEGAFDLGIAMEFIANDTPEEAAANYYGNYTTDFFIKMTGVDENTFKTTDDYDGSGCYLAGYYPSFGSWVKIPLDGFAIENGTVYPVISLVGYDFKYTDICEDVQQFVCGIYLTPDVLEKYPELKVNLSLGLSESLEAAQQAEFTTVGAYTYDKGDFGKQLVNWGTATDAGYYYDGATKYGIMRFLFHVDINAEDVVDSGIKYIRTDDIAATVVSKEGTDATNAFYGDITGVPVGTTGEYAAVAYVVTSKGFIYWSDVAVCSPNFENDYSGYNAQ